MKTNRTADQPAPDSPAASGAAPEADRRERMRGQVSDLAARGLIVQRGSEQAWQRFLPGVSVRVLHHDAERGLQTALWRLEAGARIPGHPHEADEECFLIEGALVLRGERFEAGDYMLAPAGSRHGSITSPDGALMLIRGQAVSWHERLLLRTALALGR